VEDLGLVLAVWEEGGEGQEGEGGRAGHDGGDGGGVVAEEADEWGEQGVEAELDGAEYGCGGAGCLARAHLVYGEWLRRQGRRQDAREQLRTAHELLAGMGMEAFAPRASCALPASNRANAPPDRPTSSSHTSCTSRLVAPGATSREVGAQLFLSPRTIDAHLRNMFRKLGITSRRQLRHLRLP
jgi:hypothetical protein